LCFVTFVIIEPWMLREDTAVQVSAILWSADEDWSDAAVAFSSVQFNEISSEAGQMASIPGYTIVSRNTFQYTMI